MQVKKIVELLRAIVNSLDCVQGYDSMVKRASDNLKKQFLV